LIGELGLSSEYRKEESGQRNFGHEFINFDSAN
jgi:hypothetical protein